MFKEALQNRLKLSIPKIIDEEYGNKTVSSARNCKFKF